MLQHTNSTWVLWAARDSYDKEVPQIMVGRNYIQPITATARQEHQPPRQIHFLWLLQKNRDKISSSLKDRCASLNKVQRSGSFHQHNSISIVFTFSRPTNQALSTISAGIMSVVATKCGGANSR